MGRFKEDCLKRFAIEFYRYNSNVVNNFDDKDLALIKQTTAFQVWYLKQTLLNLFRSIYESIFGR